MSKDDKWIQKANINKGALRNIAKKMGLIDNNEKLHHYTITKL